MSRKTLPPIGTHPWRLGFYRGVSDWSAPSGTFVGSESPIWEWTDHCFREGYSFEDHREAVLEVPDNFVWAIVRR